MNDSAKTIAKREAFRFAAFFALPSLALATLGAMSSWISSPKTTCSLDGACTYGFCIIFPSFFYGIARLGVLI